MKKKISNKINEDIEMNEKNDISNNDIEMNTVEIIVSEVDKVIDTSVLPISGVKKKLEIEKPLKPFPSVNNSVVINL